jgi:hypothetical protein
MKPRPWLTLSWAKDQDRTGQLQKSITWELDKRKLVLTVGSNLRGYPSYLQKGTGRMKPRPWLTLSWAKDQDRIGKLLTGGR